jgi:hypothetical protein
MPELGLKERAAARLDAAMAPVEKTENYGQNCGQSVELIELCGGHRRAGAM